MFPNFSNSHFAAICFFALINVGCDSSAVITGDVPQTGAANAVAQLQHGDFESENSAWQSCAAGGSASINTTSETEYGARAALLTKQACIYQTIAAKAGSSMQLSCKTKREGVGWAALMLGYLDSNYQPLDTKETEIVNPAFETTNIALAAPEKTAYVEVLAYTTANSALTLDNCTLNTVTDEPILISNKIADGLTPTVTSIMREQSFGSDPDDITNTNEIDWAEAWMAHNELGVWVAWKTHNEVNTNSWGLGVYLDTDQNITTGFRGFNNEYPIGVDYLIEGVEQFTYTGTGNDWSWELAAQSGTGLNKATAIRSTWFRRFGNTEAIDLFFRGANEALDGTSIDYYPNNVINADANPASRFFTYNTASSTVTPPPVIPPVLPPPPITPPTTPVGTARIDVRNQLEGADSWRIRLSEWQITVINDGLLPLTNVTVSSDVIASCSFTYPSLAVGEVKTETCANPDLLAGSFSHTVTASATGSNGQLTTDTDISSYYRALRQSPAHTIVATPNSYGAVNGDDITFTVEVASVGNYRPDISSVDSNIEDCKRQFDPALTSGEMVRYNCVATNVQIPFTAEFSTELTSATLDILATGTTSIELSRNTGGNVLSLNNDSALLSYNIRNNGVTDLFNLQVVNDAIPACNKELSSLRAGAEVNYQCNTALSNRGEILSSNAAVTAETLDGASVTDTYPLTVFARDDLKLEFLFGPANRIIRGIPGEAINTTFKIANRGYFPVTNIESVRVNQSISGTGDVSDCLAVAESIVQDPSFRIEPGEQKTYDCIIVMPTSLQLPSDFEYLFTSIGYSSSVIDGYNETSGEVHYLKKTSTQGQPGQATLLSFTPAVTDPSALPNPVIDHQNRLTLSLTNGDFESIDNTGTPTGWEKGCNGMVTRAAVNGSNGIKLENDACISYVLNANELAVLSDNNYKFSCYVNGAIGYASITTTLNGTESSTTAMNKLAAEVTDTAPQTLTSGFITLYANNQAHFDDCQLLITEYSDNIASINVSNQAEGIDAYRRYGDFDFSVRVTNDGTVPLNDIQVSSDKLNCDTNFATLEINETKTVLCSTTDPLRLWDETLSHKVLATAMTGYGDKVADSDYAGYGGNLGYYDGDIINVTVNSVDIERLAPVAIGSDVKIDIEVTRGTDNLVRLITSTIPSCNKFIEPDTMFGDVISYSCTLENIQEDTEFDLRVIPKLNDSQLRRIFNISVEQ